MNVELAVARLAANLEKLPEFAAYGRMLPQLFTTYGVPVVVGPLVIRRRDGALVALCNGELVADSTQRKNAKPVQLGSGPENRKRRTVNCDDATWALLVAMAERDHDGNVSEAFRQLIRRA